MLQDAYREEVNKNLLQMYNSEIPENQPAVIWDKILDCLEEAVKSLPATNTNHGAARIN